jgi:hypothetical protein
MTDRQLLITLGRRLAAAASVAILLVTGTAYAEMTYQPPVPVVDVIYVR